MSKWKKAVKEAGTYYNPMEGQRTSHYASGALVHLAYALEGDAIPNPHLLRAGQFIKAWRKALPKDGDVTTKFIPSDIVQYEGDQFRYSLSDAIAELAYVSRSDTQLRSIISSLNWAETIISREWKESSK